MTRLEAGAIHLNLEPCDIQDVVGAALEQLGELVDNREIKIIISEKLPLIPMDFTLIVQTIVNVIDNALKYSPVGKPIEVFASQTEEEVTIDICDRASVFPRKN
jgi:two-component system sensor histidine kinase KdpD